MDDNLQSAFYTCYKTYGKISTKLLISCTRDRTTDKLVAKIIEATENQVDYVPDPPKKFFDYKREEQDFDLGDESPLGWLKEMEVGPGLSPCVIQACEAFSDLGEETVIGSLEFLKELCRTASRGSSRIFDSAEMNIAEQLLAEAENEPQHAAAELFPEMDAELQTAFYMCYKTFGKISTRKLISCFQDTETVNAVTMVFESFGRPLRSTQSTQADIFLSSRRRWYCLVERGRSGKWGYSLRR